MSERGEQFDAAVVIYEAAQARLLELIDNPERDVPVQAYRDHLKHASRAVQCAHKAVMAAWA